MLTYKTFQYGVDIFGKSSLSLGFYDSACSFIQKCSRSSLKASLWIISALLMLYEASYFAIEIFLAWF